MPELKFLLHFIFSSQNFPVYFKIFSSFIGLAIIGIIASCAIFKSANKLRTIGAGMILGPILLLIWTSIFTYLFKGPNALKLQYYALIVISLIIGYVKRAEFKKYLNINIDLKAFLVIGSIGIYLLFFALVTGNSVIGGDAGTYWALATSFERGNYPTVLPWQAGQLTTYHHGAFQVIGVLLAVNKADVSLNHIFFSLYLLMAIFLYSTGLAREKTRGLLSLLPGIGGLVVFGPLFLTGDLGTYISNLSKLNIFSSKNIHQYTPLFPQVYYFTGAAGSGANRLDGLIYSNFLALGLAAQLVFLDIFRSKVYQENLLKKHILLLMLQMATLSITVTFMLLQAPFYAYICFKDFIIEKKYKQSGTIVILAVVAIASFFILQNPLRDGLFVEKPPEARFRIIKLNEPEFTNRLNFMDSKSYSKKAEGSWYMPNSLVFLILCLIAAIALRSQWGILLSLSGLLSIVFLLTTVNSYWLSNGLRFGNKANEFAMFAVGFIIIELWQRRRYYKIAGAILIVILIPGTINAHLFLYNVVHSGEFNNFMNYINYNNPVLNWLEVNTKYKSNQLFIDDYPQSLSSSITNEAIIHKGMFVPVSPQEYKVLTIEYAGDWFDAVSYLSPRAFKKLNVDYVTVLKTAQTHLTPPMYQQLSDPSLFTKVHEEPDAVIYKVNNKFKQSPENESTTLHKIIDAIPEHASVYLDTTERSEIRKELILRLSQKTKLSGPGYSVAGDYYMYIEATTPFHDVASTERPDNMQYAIMQNNHLPESRLTGKYEKLMSNEFITLWKKI